MFIQEFYINTGWNQLTLPPSAKFMSIVCDHNNSIYAYFTVEEDDFLPMEVRTLELVGACGVIPEGKVFLQTLVTNFGTQHVFMEAPNGKS